MCESEPERSQSKHWCYQGLNLSFAFPQVLHKVVTFEVNKLSACF